MRRRFPPALACPLLVLTLSLVAASPLPASADSVLPPLAAVSRSQPGAEAIPPRLLTSTAVDTLERLVFRYETVHFAVDSSTLLPAGKRALLRKVRWLQAHPSAAVIVEGHCDARGSAAYNRQLGARRAEAARAFLLEQGIAPDRVQIVSWGEERPDAAGSGEKAWSRNRRAECLPR